MAIQLDSYRLLEFEKIFEESEWRRSCWRSQKLGSAINPKPAFSGVDSNPVPDVVKRMEESERELSQLIGDLHWIVLLQVFQTMKADRR